MAAVGVNRDEVSDTKAFSGQVALVLQGTCVYGLSSDLGGWVLKEAPQRNPWTVSVARGVRIKAPPVLDSS